MGRSPSGMNRATTPDSSLRISTPHFRLQNDRPIICIPYHLFVGISVSDSQPRHSSSRKRNGRHCPLYTRTPGATSSLHHAASFARLVAGDALRRHTQVARPNRLADRSPCLCDCTKRYHGYNLMRMLDRDVREVRLLPINQPVWRGICCVGLSPWPLYSVHPRNGRASPVRNCIRKTITSSFETKHGEKSLLAVNLTPL
jgi:hypothetical protein